MVEQKNENQLSSIEKNRMERKERLKRQKAGEGLKHSVKTGSHFSKIMYPIIIVFIVVVVFLWLFFSLGYAEKLASPITIGKNKVSVIEYNYYYKALMNQYAQFANIPIDENGSPDVQAESSLDPGHTWDQYFKGKINETLQDIYLKAAAAKEAGLSLDEDAQKRIDGFFETYRKDAGSNDVALHNRLVEEFGRGASEANLREIFERSFLAYKYDEEHLNTYAVSDDEIDQYYDAHKDDLDMVDYYSVIVEPADRASEDIKQNEEAKKEAQAVVKKLAEDLNAEVTDEDSFKKMADRYIAALPDNKQTQYKAGSIEGKHWSYRADMIKGSIPVPELSDWLFDANRKAGDHQVFSTENSSYVVYFVNRKKDDRHLPSVRHILFATNQLTGAEGGNPESSEDAQAKLEESAKQMAEDTLSKINNADDMKRLGDTLFSTKQAAESKEYTDISYGKMVPEFNDWIFDPNRKAGDKAIVKTQFGYHVVFFELWSERPSWAIKAVNEIKKQKYEDEIKSLKEKDDYKVQEHGFGMRFVKP